MKISIVPSILFLIVSHCVFTQTFKITGQVVSHSGESVPFSTITIKDMNKGVVSNEDGQFTLRVNKKGSYTLVFSSVGFEEMEQKVKVNDVNQNIGKVLLNNSTEELEEVVISSEAESALIELKGFSVEAIEMKSLHTQSIDINRVLDRTAGVRVRRSGGMGSDFIYSLDGMTGNSVRFFVDGIPMDYFGSSYSINNIPTSLIQRVEIYKGVVPAELGSDALGGAINLISNQSYKNFIEASYSIGSFGTHQATLQFQRRANSGFTTRFSAFYNYSDNDYKVWGTGVLDKDSNTGKVIEYTRENPARRFNDDFETINGKIDVGFTNTPWVDQLFIGLVASDLERGLQTAQTMGYVFGDVRYNEHFFMPNITLKKEDFLVNGLSINFFGAYSELEGTTVDTSYFDYDWSGTPENWDDSYGETTGQDLRSQFTLREESLISRVNATYAVGASSKIGINYLYKDVERDGNEKFPSDFRSSLQNPQSLRTQFIGLTLQNKLFKDKLDLNFFAKHYRFNATIFDEGWITEDIDGDGEDDTEFITFETSNENSYWGGGTATSYELLPETLLKLSFERAIRLPDPDEALGNGNFILNNPDIRPEKSWNANLGVVLGDYSLGLNHTLKVEIGAFYRNTEDQLLFTVIEADGDGQYRNINKTLGKGLEIDIHHEVSDFLEFTVNATYLDIRNNQKFTPGEDGNTIEDITYKDRLRNTPYLTANAGMKLMLENTIQDDDRLFSYFQSGYVHSYYLRWPSLAEDGKAEIPTQLVFDFGLGYTFPNENISAAIDVTNILNRQVYDNYLLQRPGRAFQAKLRYQLNFK
ncbi:MAG: TonB-dependent receptor [Bacteroidota bacterium]